MITVKNIKNRRQTYYHSIISCSLFANGKNDELFREEIHVFRPTLQLFYRRFGGKRWGMSGNRFGIKRPSMLIKSPTSTLPLQVDEELRWENVNLLPMCRFQYLMVKPLEVKVDNGIVEKFFLSQRLIIVQIDARVLVPHIAEK